MQKKYHDVRAHRYSWELRYGPILSSIALVCHKCDNPRCVNPDHLFLGETYDNMRDRDQKERQARGIKSGNAKLNEDQVKYIKQLINEGLSDSEIFNIIPIRKSTIWSIRNKKSWKHIIL
jgi:hypothetical protein